MSLLLTTTVVRASVPAITQVAARALSTQTTSSLMKLRSLLEDYRQHNYTQELPTRFKKEVVSAAASGPNKNSVELSGLQRLLLNIGAANSMSISELQSIFREVGNENGEITAPKFIQLI